MRHYLIDGSNAVRRRDYDPRFPEVEAAKTEAWLARLDRLCAPFGGIRVEIFFDGPRRPLGGPYPTLALRFSDERSADDMILGAVRLLARAGRGAVVVTEDSGLAAEAREDGARLLRFGEFEARLRARKA